MDLVAGGRLGAGVRRRSRSPTRSPNATNDCGEELTEAEHVDGAQRWRIARRVDRLNNLGFDVAELDLRRTPTVVRISRRWSMRVSLPAPPTARGPGRGREPGTTTAQRPRPVLCRRPRRGDADRDPGYRCPDQTQREVAREDVIAAHRWLSDVYEPVISAVPSHLRTKLRTRRCSMKCWNTAGTYVRGSGTGCRLAGGGGRLRQHGFAGRSPTRRHYSR